MWKKNSRNRRDAAVISIYDVSVGCASGSAEAKAAAQLAAPAVFALYSVPVFSDTIFDTISDTVSDTIFRCLLL